MRTSVRTFVAAFAAANVKQSYASYFFCSTNNKGTEGIKPTTNFVPFLTFYRDFLGVHFESWLGVLKYEKFFATFSLL